MNVPLATLAEHTLPAVGDVQVFEADLNDPAHADAIVKLLSALAASEFGRQQAMTDDEKAALVPGLAAFPAKQIWLASINDNICGVVICYLQFSIYSSKNMLNIHDLYTDPVFRRRGVAEGLVKTAIDWAHNQGHAFVNIEVANENSHAMALYHKLGFGEWLAPTTFLEIRL